MRVINSVAYKAGAAVARPTELEALAALLADPDALLWVSVLRPTSDDLLHLEELMGLDPEAVANALLPHRRTRVARYGDTVFATVQSARYDDANEVVEFCPVQIFLKTNAVITVRYDDMPDVAQVRARLERRPERLALGPMAVLFGVISQVLDEYGPVLDGVTHDVDEIEVQIFDHDSAVARRIFDLTREVIDFQRATHPLHALLVDLDTERRPADLLPALDQLRRELRDHAARVVEQVDALRAVLQNALTVHSTLVAQRQNAQMQELAEADFRQNAEVKKISAWAAILFAPSLIGTVYGMNFDDLPLQHWRWGFDASLAGMAAMSAAMYLIFRKKKWL